MNHGLPWSRRTFPPTLRKKDMPQTISESNLGQIIGGIFSSHSHADQAVKAFREMGFSEDNIQLVEKINGDEAEDTYTALMLTRGMSGAQALYHNKVVREGKVFLAVYNVIDPAPVIDVFNHHKAEFNPDGGRNLRNDVFGMTAGAAVGAVSLGVVGAVVAGPPGAAIGAAAGAVLGGGAGASGGTTAEHEK